MTVTVNGKERSAPEGTTLLALLKELSISKEDKGVAIAVDLNVISRDAWDKMIIQGGMSVEIVHAVAGG